MESAVNNFALSDSPDYEELLKITEIIQDYISSEDFNRAIGYPVYPNGDYNDGIRSIAESILKDGRKYLEIDKESKQFYKLIIGRFSEVDENYTWDIMSR